MEFAALINTIILMAIFIFSGGVLAHFVTPTADVRRFLMVVIINIALPSIILYGIFQLEVDANLFNQVLLIFLLSVGSTTVGILISYGTAKLLRFPIDRVKEIAFLGGIGNTAIVGIPLCAALFGPIGALFAAIFDAGICLMLWTVGVALLNDKQKFTFKLTTFKSVLSAPLLAAVTGLILASLNLKPTGIVYDVVESFANLTTPLAMMYVGMLIYVIISKHKPFSIKLLCVPVFLKLIALPMLVMLFLIPFQIDETILMVILIETAMPSITIASILMGKYGKDEDFGALTTLVSIVLSLITIPFIIILGRIVLL